MPFGICSAPEEFQRHVNEIIKGLEGVTAIADDLLVTGAGNTHEEALADHDRNLIVLLQRCKERNFKLNKEKFVFKQTAPQSKFIELHGVNNETGQIQLSDIKNESKSEPVPIRQGVRRSQRQVKPNSKYKDFVLFK